MRALRRRFVYPCADLVFQRPSVDASLDTLIRSFGVNRGRPSIRPNDPERAVAVLGFPRSGNTFLESWLRWLALPGTEVLDGRLTHSVLDAYRLSRSGVAVLIPVRAPLQTCASWLVRSDSYDSIDAGRQTLRAYTAWYSTAARLRDDGSRRVVRFAEFTGEPTRVSGWAHLGDLIRAPRPEDVEEFERSLRAELRDVPGQGKDLDGTPAHQMISLPNHDRRPLLQEALDVLEDPRLSKEREEAVAAFMRLDARADSELRVETSVS